MFNLFYATNKFTLSEIFLIITLDAKVSDIIRKITIYTRV